MSSAFCIVCGSEEVDVQKLHYFPRNPHKSKMWQALMGMKVSENTIRHRRICNKHFTLESYSNDTDYILNRNAVPTRYPCGDTVETHTERNCTPVPIQVEEPKEDICLPSTSRGLRVSSADNEELENPHSETSSSVPSTPVDRSSTPLPSSVGFRGQSSIFKKLSQEDTTPRKKIMFKVISKKADHIRQLKKLCKERANKIKEMCDLSNSDVRNIFKDLKSSTVDFLISQLRCAKRPSKGRRWTLDEKIIALALMKRSPRCYSLFRKIVYLPSKRTLTALLEHISFNTGINLHLFQHINHCLGTTNDEDRYCVLLFDEMDIKENLQYDRATDRIIGYQDLGVGRSTNEFANRALVFVAQGLSKRWKQPLAYYFSKNGVDAGDLAAIIKDVLQALKDEAKLHVVGIVCDMGTSNVKALKSLGTSVAHPYIEHDGDKIHIVFDPPNLLKCTVALFRKHSVLLPVQIGDEILTMEAKFSDIVEAYKIDERAPLIFRSLHKLTPTHLAPIMRFAMKVKIAAQVMSRTVAAFLFTLLSQNLLPQRSLATATFVHQVDELFESFNGTGKTAPDGKELRCCVSNNSPHMTYWKKSYKMVQRWKFRRITKTGKLMKKKPPSQVGWMVSIKSIQAIWKLLKSKGFQYLRQRSINQDPVENLFGAVRSGCGSNDNPTCIQFTNSLKTQILNGLTKQDHSGSNCEEDDSILLSDLRSFINMEMIEEPGAVGILNQTNELPQCVTGTTSKQDVRGIAEAVAIGSVETLSIAYVSGYIAGRLLKEVNCTSCQEYLTSNPELPHNQFITFKEYSETKKNLSYPSEHLTVIVGHGITQLEYVLESMAASVQIEKKLSEHLHTCLDFTWITCPSHSQLVKDKIVTGICRIGIPWWCTRRNREQKERKKDIRASKRKLKKLTHK